MNVLLEALVVGLALIPIYWVVQKLGQPKWITIFLAGAVFHLVAELTGVNKAYARMKL
jgi:hypothetical protein